MNQPRLVVPTEVVRGLVDAFDASPKGRNGRYCSSWPDNKIVLAAALTALPEIESGFVDYGAASRILDDCQCFKMASFCNSWTPWMRDVLRRTKTPGAPTDE